MFSVGSAPWHGLGHVLEQAPTIGEAITLAGLNWRVALRPMVTTLPGGTTPIPVPGHNAVLREDTGSILGVVGAGFRPLQNVDAFEFFAPLVADRTLELETAGCLREGRRVWIMARVPGEPAVIVRGAEDIVERYVLLCHGHDGSLALRLGFNPVRVVCANTLSAALAEGDGLFTLRHTAGMGDELERVRRVIAAQIEIFGDAAEGWRHLAGRTCDDGAFTAYALRVFATLRGEGEDAAEVVPGGAVIGRRLLEQVRPLFEGGAGNDRSGVRGTWWAAYNAITQWLTHLRGSAAGTERERAERRFDALHLGPGRKLGVRALMLALEGADRSPASGVAALPAEPLPLVPAVAEPAAEDEDEGPADE